MGVFSILSNTESVYSLSMSTVYARTHGAISSLVVFLMNGLRLSARSTRSASGKETSKTRVCDGTKTVIYRNLFTFYFLHCLSTFSISFDPERFYIV